MKYLLYSAAFLAYNSTEILRRFMIRALSVVFFPFFLLFFLFSTIISYLHGKGEGCNEFYDFTTGAAFFKFLVWNLIILGGRE